MLKKIVIFSIPFVLASCASTNHKYMRGSVAMKLNNNTAHVCLGDKEVKVGDRLTFYYNDCDQFDSEVSGLKGLCTLKKLGAGEVKKIHNSHYSTVETDGSFEFKEGTLVQREKL